MDLWYRFWTWIFKHKRAVSVYKLGESHFCFSDECLSWSICSFRLLKQDAFRFTLCILSPCQVTFIALCHMYIFYGWVTSATLKSCLNLLVLHWEMSLLMIYPNCHLRWGMRIIYVVLVSKFFYWISWGED